VIYCDTSYLVRLYLDDRGFQAVRELCSKQPVASAAHAQAELPAALHRAWREGRLQADAFAALMEQFETDCSEGAFQWQPITARLFAGVGALYRNLPSDTFLRAADALHLLCAVSNGFTEAYSHDRHFLAAAPRFGLKGVDVIGG
jgi:predicted nucleic acid-binding protein